MLQNIKRIGIVTIILSVIFCLVFAVCVGVNYTNNEQNVKIANDEQSLNNADFNAEIVLKSDTEGTIAQKWSKAIKLSIKQSREVSVELGQNWVATYDSVAQRTYFGKDDDGFSGSYSLYVPENANIKLNLAGYTINKNQTSYNPLNGANVISVAGTLSIYDTSYNSEDFKDIYDRYKANKDSFVNRINAVQTGAITGGYLIGAGAGVFVDTTGTVNMYGGKIKDNKIIHSGGGAGVYCAGTFNFYDGMICGNEIMNAGSGVGAGISVNGGNINISGGFLVNNTGNFYGGGIDIRNKVAELLNASVSNCIIAHNYSHYGGGISINYTTHCDLQNVDISYNVTDGNSSGVAIWDKGEAVLENCKITNNSAYRSNTGDTNGGAGITSNGKTIIINSEITDNCFWNGIDLSPAYGAGITYRGSIPLVLQDVLLARNIIKSDLNDGTNAFGGGIYSACDIEISGNMQVYDNIAHGIASDIRVEKGNKIVVNNSLENAKGRSKIGLKIATNYGDGTFTTGYSTTNSGSNPNKYFFNNDGAYMAVLSGGEICFEKTIESEKYDFVYFENNMRKTYLENGFAHTNNDFDKSQTVNDKKIVLGKISPNTSVNEFLDNINFDNTKLKLYNGKELIYNKSEQTSYNDLYENGLELAVGTGWKLEVYSSKGDLIEDIYLSVLGDITGDGKVNSADCNYLRQIVSSNSFNNLRAELKLSSLVINKGRQPNNTDTQILWEVVCGRVNINDFI